VADKEEKAVVTEETSERVERITLAMANGEKLSEEDMLWIADFNEKQAVIQAALKEGRRLEESPIRLDEHTTAVQWTEFLPMPGGDVLMRRGTDIIKEGMFGIEVTRTASYYNPRDPFRAGMIESLISGGKEEVTNITGDIFGDLQIGDTRPSPIPSTGFAGARPSSWDPSSGKFGFASGGSNPSGGSSPSGGSGPSSSTGSTQTGSSGPSQSDSPVGGGLGSPGAQSMDGAGPSGTGLTGSDPGGSDGGDPMGDSVDADPGETDTGGSDGGDPMGDSVDPDPGQTDPGGTDGGDPSSGQTNDQAPAQDSGSTTSGDADFTVEGEFEHVENVNTGQVGAEMQSGDIMTTEGMVKPVEGHWADTDERIASDDYYSAGSADIPKPGEGGTDSAIEKSGGGGGGSGGYSMSWEQWQAQQAATWSDPNWNPDGAPIDYGNTSDPLYDPVTPDPGTPQDDPNTQILVDPSFYEQSEVNAGIELEMVGALENTGNPLDEHQSAAPSGSMPTTSEQELVGEDAMAMASAELGSVAEGPEPGSVGAEEPEHGGPAPGMEHDPLP
jgi:hypothetical protein